MAVKAGFAVYATACIVTAFVSPSPDQMAPAGDGVHAAMLPDLLFGSPALAGHRGRRNSGRDDGDFEENWRGQQQQQRESERQSRVQQRDSERQAREQQRDSERQAREQQRDSERQAREQQRSVEQEPRRTTPEESPRAEPVQSSNGNDSGHDGGQGRGEGQAVGGEPQNGNSANGTNNSSDQNHDERGDRSRSDEASGPDDSGNGPATTVLEWFDKLGKPAQPPKETAAGSRPPQKPVTSANDNAKKPKNAVGGVNLGIDLPVFERPHVLAVNASAKTVERAAQLGFKSTGVTSLSGLSYGVTSFVAPQGMSAAEAQALLTREVPEATVAINQTYALIRTATGASAGQRISGPAVSAPPGGAVPCSLDRCFGSDVVGWKPELRNCASGLKIGIIDTSIDVRHPAFVRKKIELRHLGQATVPGPDWHGTGVTALLAGDTSSGTPGLIPNASFYVADVFRAGGDNQPVSDTLSMLRAFDWLEAKNVKLINMSLSGPKDALIEQAIEKLSAKGIIFVAAAGNGGPNSAPSYPAAYDEVIAVTAIGKNLQSYRYANRGKYIDIAAPGVDIWTAQPGSKEGFQSGTSFAAPYVTAAVAAVYGSLPSAIPNDILKQLKYRDLGEPGLDAVYGRGLLVAPSACAGGQIAKAQDVPSVQLGETARRSRTAVQPPASLGNPPAVTPSGGKPEVLPWLPLQNSSN